MRCLAFVIRISSHNTLHRAQKKKSIRGDKADETMTWVFIMMWRLSDILPTRSGGLLHTRCGKTSKMSQLVGAIFRSEDLASSALHGDAPEYLQSNSSLCANLAGSTATAILSVFSPISTTVRVGVRKFSTNQRRQVFRRNHAENNSAFLASNKKREPLL